MGVREAIRDADALLPGEPAPDGEPDPRWQAILQVSDSIETDPEPIWAFAARWGCHSQEDLRDAIATVLLEHLLEHYFALIFPRVRELACRLGAASAHDSREDLDALFPARPGRAAIDCAIDCVGAKSSVEYLMDRTEHVVALFGVNDLIVVDTPDALLVTTRDRAQRVGEILKTLEQRRREDLL